MTKVITFLGIYPQSTTYIMPDGNKRTASSFGAALAHLMSDLEFYVFVTNKAAGDSLTIFRQEVAGLANLTPVPIPDGDNVDELWEIFDRVVQTVEDGDSVIFDITHSFRSVTFLSFLAAAYLRTVKQINLVSVLYGNYEAAKKHPSGYAPVIDMTPFVCLLDWTVAADRFIQTGDARPLAGLINPGLPNAGASAGASEGAGDDPAAVAAKSLSDVSLAAFLCQPFHLLPEAQQLGARLAAAEQVLNVDARPYRTLHRQIVEEFGAFGAMPDADDKTKLRAQLHLIEWYHTNKQLIQAMTLAREWFISAVMVKFRLPIDDLSLRDTMAKNINDLCSYLAKTADGKQEPSMTVNNLKQYARSIYAWPERQELALLWGQLRKARNALDHAGYLYDSMQMDDIVSSIDGTIMPKLCVLADQWGFGENAKCSC